MKNKDENTIYRNCLDENEGNCSYVCLNEYKSARCSIDNITQVEWYGCVPQEILDRIKEE